MYLKIILYMSILFFIGCSTHYQGSGVAVTKDIYIQKDNDKNISLIINNFVDEVDREEIEKLIVSDLNKLGYSVSTKKPFLSKKLYIDLIELKSLITTQNSDFSFLNFGFDFLRLIAVSDTSINRYRSLTSLAVKSKAKDYKEVPVYILISKIKIIQETKMQKTKIIAEEIQKSSIENTISQLEKKLSSQIFILFKQEKL